MFSIFHKTVKIILQIIAFRFQSFFLTFQFLIELSYLSESLKYESALNEILNTGYNWCSWYNFHNDFVFCETEITFLIEFWKRLSTLINAKTIKEQFIRDIFNSRREPRSRCATKFLMLGATIHLDPLHFSNIGAKCIGVSTKIFKIN